MSKTKYGKYIVTELITTRMDQEYEAEYAKWATRILQVNDQVVNKPYHLGCCWYLKPPAKQLDQHSHDSEEILGFFGSNPEDPYDLGGEIEFWLEDEKHVLTKSCLIFLPKGMKHGPLIIRRIDRPIFHLGTLMKL